MKILTILSMLLLGVGTVIAEENDNLALQKEIVSKIQKSTDNPELFGPPNINANVVNPAKNRVGADDTVVVGTGQALKGEFLPMYDASDFDQPVTDLVFNALLKINKTGKYEPDLIESMPEISEDKKTYTVKLKDGIKFSDGKPLTSEDVIFTYETIADPSYDGGNIRYVENIVGFKDFNEGDAKHLEGIKAFDDKTIQFKFQKPMMMNMSFLDMRIIPKHYYMHEKGDIKPLKNKINKPLGAGPYKLKKFLPRQYTELTLNENYFGTKPKIENIIIRTIDTKIMTQALVNGEIDIYVGIGEPEPIETANKTGYINRNQFLRHGYGYLHINNEDPVMKDPKVRQALLYGLDRQALLDLYYKGLAVPLDIPASQTWWMYDKDFDKKLTHYDYNPEKAKKLLDEAGWEMAKDGYRYKDGDKMEIIWAATKDVDLVNYLMPILLQNWKELGVDVKISMLDFNTLLDVLQYERKGYSISNLGENEKTVFDPYQAWHSNNISVGGSNTSLYSDKTNDELIDKMIVETDEEKFKEIWQEWALYVNQQLPRYVLYSNLLTDLYNDRIKNLETTAVYNWQKAIVNAEIQK